MGINKDSEEQAASNTEYLPTKCRITRPPPPKPATNPLQFVKVGPCPLYKKAQEQIKKVEEVKVVRQEMREEAEDWQHNLDNWKSSRRKRQEHIIERVEEVKKLEQEQEQGRGRRRSTTFSEIVEKRKGRPKFNMLIYDDDSNDLSDYGIGSSSSKTNSIKDVDTDDNSSILDDKDMTFEVKDSNQSEIESSPKPNANLPKSDTAESLETPRRESIKSDTRSEYTYEGAIQDYRSRIRTKININESFLQKTDDTSKSKEFSEAQTLLPKGNLFKRKEMFEGEKNVVEIAPYEHSTTQRLSEDFANSQSIKERLKSLEKCTDQSITGADKNCLPAGTVKSRLQKFNNQISDFDTKNNNETETKSISSYLLDKTNSNSSHESKNWSAKSETFDGCSSTDEDIFMDKLNVFNRDLDTLYSKSDNGLDDFATSPYLPSSSSTDLMAMSSDREDSGIHTADVSCSVSQSDEAFEDPDIPYNTIPRCIEKLNKEKIATKINNPVAAEIKQETTQTVEFLKVLTLGFLNYERNHCSQLYDNIVQEKHSSLVENIEKTIQEEDPTPIYENVDLKNNIIDLSSYPIEYINDDVLTAPLSPATKLRPPSEKPPPPPPEEETTTSVKRLNSTKRIKKELHIKRSSFLGLEESGNQPIDLAMSIEKPPDVNSFLQMEVQHGKNLYNKILESSQERSEVEAVPKENGAGEDVATPKKPNKIVSEEDEITKKEREIIELIEKEEKSRDFEHSPINTPILVEPDNKPPTHPANTIDNSLGSKVFDNPYFPESQFDNLDEQDSEVLKVEHELLQLEREELERQRENILFREKSAKLKQNRHSYDNICDADYYGDNMNYRKSMPELLHADLSKPPQKCYLPVNDSMQHRKSMPDIQHAYNRSVADYCIPIPQYSLHKPPNYNTSMPDLQEQHVRSAFTAMKNPPIKAGYPLKPLVRDVKEKFMQGNLKEPDTLYTSKQPIARHNLHALSAVPKARCKSNWIHPKANPEVKSYNQHWLYQEAELRRLSEHKSLAGQSDLLKKQKSESSIPSYTQKVHGGYADNRNSPKRSIRAENMAPKDYREYMRYTQRGHAMQIPYPTTSTVDDGQDIMLSVSGKKKCSYCGNELGRGAAMIIESLCLFYHMECFKCCVCHVELGDGLMGTDVRVRNQKLHCHNCYSSDDGIKFSCV